MKKLSRISMMVFLFIFVICFVGCTQNEDTLKDREKDTLEDTPHILEETPSTGKYGTIPEEEIPSVKASLDELSIEEAEDSIEDQILSFLQEEDRQEFALKDIVLTKDHLSLKRGENRKPYLNMVLEVELQMDTELMNAMEQLNSKEIANEFSYQLNVSLRNNLYFIFKVCRLNIDVLNEANGLINSFEQHTFDLSEEDFIQQEEAEFQVQTIAYDYRKKYHFLTLYKFGILEELKTLYLSYYVYDEYFEKYTEDDLQTFYEEIRKDFMSHKAVMDYITTNELKSVMISFESGNFEKGQVDFDIQL